VKKLELRLPFYNKHFLVMLVKRTFLALLATRALFSLATPMNSLTVQVTVQDSSLSLESDDTCGIKEPAVAPESQDPQVNLDDATLFGIVKGKTHQFLGIPFAHPP
jgi:hypothetical protein